MTSPKLINRKFLVFCKHVVMNKSAVGGLRGSVLIAECVFVFFLFCLKSKVIVEKVKVECLKLVTYCGENCNEFCVCGLFYC